MAVALGAFAAHALGNSLDEYSRDVWQKANFYQFIHGFGLIALGIVSKLELIQSKSAFKIACIFTLGILFFCGSLYLLALTGIRWLGAITPIGGILFLFGWFYLGMLLFKDRLQDLNLK